MPGVGVSDMSNVVVIERIELRADQKSSIAQVQEFSVVAPKIGAALLFHRQACVVRFERLDVDKRARAVLASDNLATGDKARQGAFAN